MLTFDGQRVIPAVDPQLAGLGVDVLLADRDDSLWFASLQTIGRVLSNGVVEEAALASAGHGHKPEITSLYEAPSGAIWQTSRVMGLLRIGADPIRRYSYTEGLQSTFVTAVAAADPERLYVATNRGLALIERGVIKPLLNEDFVRGDRIRVLALEGSERLWVGTEKGVREYDLSAAEQATPVSQWLPEHSITSILPSADGSVWIGSDRGLFQLNDNVAKPVPETLGLSVRALLQDASGAIWLGTDGGIRRLAGGHLSTPWRELIEDIGPVVSLAQTPAGTIVAATEDRGIVVSDGPGWRKLTEPQGIPPEQLIDIEVAGDHLWMVTGAGVFRAPLEELDSQQSDNLLVEPVATLRSYRSAFETFCCRGTGDSAAAIAANQLLIATDDGVVSFSTEVMNSLPAAPKPYIRRLSSPSGAALVASKERLALPASDQSIRVDYSAIRLAGPSPSSQRKFSAYPACSKHAFSRSLCGS